MCTIFGSLENFCIFGSASVAPSFFKTSKMSLAKHNILDEYILFLKKKSTFKNKCALQNHISV